MSDPNYAYGISVALFFLFGYMLRPLVDKIVARRLKKKIKIMVEKKGDQFGTGNKIKIN